MRHLFLIALASLLLGGIGCSTDDPETQREIEADRRQFWGGPTPDQALGIEPMPTETVAQKK